MTLCRVAVKYLHVTVSGWPDFSEWYFNGQEFKELLKSNAIDRIINRFFLLLESWVLATLQAAGRFCIFLKWMMLPSSEPDNNYIIVCLKCNKDVDTLLRDSIYCLLFVKNSEDVLKLDILTFLVHSYWYFCEK